jgi:hypothetical protein
MPMTPLPARQLPLLRPSDPSPLPDDVEVEARALLVDPDRRICEAIALVFRKFRETGSIRQVLLCLRQERIDLPAVLYGGEGRSVVWDLPVNNSVHNILTNPIYGGAYAYGRTKSVVHLAHAGDAMEIGFGGRKHVVRGHRVNQNEWTVLLPDHHEGYIAWAEYQANQQQIMHNAAMKGVLVRGSARGGGALLAGLLRCGHCGRRLHVAYSGIGGKCLRYACRGGAINHGVGIKADRIVTEELLTRLQPLGMQAALDALDQRAQQTDERLVQKQLALEQARYEVARARRQYDAVDPEHRLVASPAAFATAAPMEFGGNMPIAAEGITPAGELPGLRRIKFAFPGYFSTLGIPLLAGRDFTWADVYDQREVAIVSAKMARETWGDGNAALGKRIQIGIGTPWREVVGVVGDVREDGTDDEPPAMVYWRAGIFRIFAPGDIDFSRGIAFVVRTDRAGTESLVKEVQEAVWSVNRNVPVAFVRTLQEIYASTRASESFTLVMLGIAAAMALTLGVVGIYGVVSYMAARRHREIGLRLALGAQPRDVQRLFVTHGLVLAVIGVLLGAGAATALTRLASSLLFGVSPVDPSTYVVGAVVLLVAALLASYVPIRRALGTDPAAALKSE